MKKSKQLESLRSVPQVSCTSEQCSVVSQIHVEGPVGTLRGCTTAV